MTRDTQKSTAGAKAGKSIRGRNAENAKQQPKGVGRGAKAPKRSTKKAATQKTAGSKPHRTSATPTSIDRFAKQLFIKSRKSKPCGVGVGVLVMASQNDTWKTHLNESNLCLPGETRGNSTWNRGVKGVASAAKCKRGAELLNAVANPHRMKILAKLLQGPATYQALVKATGLKVGPLYHHIGQLRLASLVAPRERDLYRITVGGQNALLGLLALLPLMTDGRVIDE